MKQTRTLHLRLLARTKTLEVVAIHTRGGLKDIQNVSVYRQVLQHCILIVMRGMKLKLLIVYLPGHMHLNIAT
jgi:hypothetical protein